MIKSIVCFKWVADEEEIRSNFNPQSLQNAKYKISDNDRNAIEEAMSIKEQLDGSVMAITVASDRRCIKDALSRGPEGIYYINAPEAIELEPSVTRSILASALKDIPYDLIFCGVGSNDFYAQQVGPELAEKLGIPCLTYVSELQVNEEKGEVIAKRRLNNEVEIVTAQLPLLITVLPDINEARIPGLSDILGAGQKTVIDIDCRDLQGDFQPALHTTSIAASNMERKCLKLSSDQQDLRKVVNELLRIVNH